MGANGTLHLSARGILQNNLGGNVGFTFGVSWGGTNVFFDSEAYLTASSFHTFTMTCDISNLNQANLAQSVCTLKVTAPGSASGTATDFSVQRMASDNVAIDSTSAQTVAFVAQASSASAQVSVTMYAAELSLY